MNWYDLLYWSAISQNLNTFMFVLAIVSSVIFIISTLVFMVYTNSLSELEPNAHNYRSSRTTQSLSGTALRFSSAIALITWLFVTCTPSKSDSIFMISIIAATEMNKNDSTKNNIPPEILTFVKSEIRRYNEINKPIDDRSRRLESLQGIGSIDRIIEVLRADTAHYK